MSKSLQSFPKARKNGAVSKEELAGKVKTGRSYSAAEMPRPSGDFTALKSPTEANEPPDDKRRSVRDLAFNNVTEKLKRPDGDEGEIPNLDDEDEDEEEKPAVTLEDPYRGFFKCELNNYIDDKCWEKIRCGSQCLVLTVLVFLYVTAVVLTGFETFDKNFFW